MIFATISWVIISLLIGVVTLYAVWSRRDTKYRLYAFLSFLVVVPLSAAPIAASMGWSTPCRLALALSDEYTILGYQGIPEQVIYLFVDTKYGPKTCSIPWANYKYEQLKEGLKKGGTGAILKGTSPFTSEGDPNIWNPPPEPALPPKPEDNQ